MENDVQALRRQITERNAKLRQRWHYLTDHIEDPNMATLVANLLENQAQGRVPLFDADQNTGNLPTSVFPTQIAFPTIVQTFPALAANELVQVTALAQPRASVLYQRFIRSSDGSDLPHSGSWTRTAESGLPPKARTRLDILDLSVEKYMMNMEWTAELEEDAQSLGAIDIQSTMVAALRDEISAEMDWMVIQDLFAAAGSAPVLGPNGMVTDRGGAGNVNFSFAAAGNAADGTKEKQELLLDALIDLKVQIWRKCYRQPDFIVGSPEAVARIEKMQSFAPSGETQVKINGATKVGRLAGQYDVYTSAVAPMNKLLMGVKRAGYVFGLYKPFELTTTNYDNNTDEYIRGIRTRVARKQVDGAYYGTLTITG